MTPMTRTAIGIWFLVGFCCLLGIVGVGRDVDAATIRKARKGDMTTARRNHAGPLRLRLLLANNPTITAKKHQRPNINMTVRPLEYCRVHFLPSQCISPIPSCDLSFD